MLTGMQGQNKREPKDLWREPVVPASAWMPCADQRNWEPSGETPLCVCTHLDLQLCENVIYVSWKKELMDQSLLLTFALQFLLLTGGNNGYILVTANGGMNQQRVAVSTACDANFIICYISFMS